MAATLEELANKQPGELIRSQDWNDLVTNILALRDELRGGITAASARIDQVDAAVAELGTRVDTLGPRIEALEALSGEFFRVTLTTSQRLYALGDLVEIEARVLSLSGEPLTFAEDARPWVDFITTWGQLSAVGGFTTVMGTENRGVSVRTDSQGIARVRVRADHVEGLAIETDDDVAGALTTVLPANNRSLAAEFILAQTPAEAQQRGVFKAVSAMYDRDAPRSFRRYVDQFYLKQTQTAASSIKVTPITRWRDYRCTVLALVKHDIDPLTPDPVRATSSIQVTFRDWILPWLLHDYFVDIGPLVKDLVARLNPKITANYAESLDGLKLEVNDFVQSDDLIAKHRNYRVAGDALDKAGGDGAPAFTGRLTGTMRDAVNIQHTLSTVQFVTAGMPEGEVAFDVFTNAATTADADVAGLDARVAALDQRVGSVARDVQRVTSDLGTHGSSLQVLGRRIDDALADTGPFKPLRDEVTTLRGQVQHLRDLNPSDITDKLGRLDEIGNRVDLLQAIVTPR